MCRSDVCKWQLKQGSSRSRRARLKWIASKYGLPKEGGDMKKMIKWAFGILWGFFGLYGLFEWVGDRLFR